MALKNLLLLWDITLLIHCVTSLCNVTCSTDYDVSVNCSCSEITTYPTLLQLHCRNENEVVNGSCEVRRPLSWCVMNPEDLELVTSIGAVCTAAASYQVAQEIMKETESSNWALSEVVKAQTPSNVQVTNTDGFYNISWAGHNPDDCLSYMVRIRQSQRPSKAIQSLVTQSMYMRLDHSQLQPRVKYTVDVQAKMCPGHFYQGPWSEWSAAAEWRTAADWRTAGAPRVDKGINGYCWFVLLPIVLVFCLLLWCFHRLSLPKGLQVVTFIPRANVFFEPLYDDNGGNFKEWVKPLFSEFDYLRINSHVQLVSEKQYDIPQLSEEKKSFRGDNETSNGGHLLRVLQPQSNLLLHFQGDGSSQDTGHSAGHVSIHTVTLSGEEYEEEVMSQSSLTSYQDEESFGLLEEVDREHAGYDSEGPQQHGQSGMLPVHENKTPNESSGGGNINFQPHAEFNEPERISLDSFASNEQSEDGYPRVDLDTIDSGFAECSSPGASDTDKAEDMDSALFREQNNSNSNYVKQWMICDIIQEDDSKSDNELCETQ